MREIIEAVQSWRDRRIPIALATVVGVERSAPRDPRGFPSSRSRSLRKEPDGARCKRRARW